jgi:hypothetical protein
LSNSQKPIVAVGTEFAAGTAEGIKEFSFSQVERFCNDQRSLSQA